MQNVSSPWQLMESIIIVTDQQTSHFDIANSDFSAASYRQVRITLII
jgi:hypothetical protein